MTAIATPTPRRDRGAVLGAYQDAEARRRELVLLAGAGGSVLVVDRDAGSHADRRLVAHLGADEPAENVALVCESYLERPAGRWCRRLCPEDLHVVPFQETALDAEEDLRSCAGALEIPLVDGRRRTYRLELLAGELSIPEWRWCRREQPRERAQPVSVREVVGALERYEPVLGLTAAVLAAHREDPRVSVVALGCERRRMRASRIVLNRGLREAVLAALAGERVSMSEIAMRCGRVKRDGRGVASGETSWLARRVGMLPESGASDPTPWVHSEVLGLIARAGLGLSPHEVEAA
jgi:hypothetical protein